MIYITALDNVKFVTTKLRLFFLYFHYLQHIDRSFHILNGGSRSCNTDFYEINEINRRNSAHSHSSTFARHTKERLFDIFDMVARDNRVPNDGKDFDGNSLAHESSGRWKTASVCELFEHVCKEILRVR